MSKTWALQRGITLYVQIIKRTRVSGKNLKNKQKAVFLDRDGTINKYVGFLRKIDDFELIDGVAAAIRKILMNLVI